MQKSIRNNVSTAFTLIMAMFVLFCFFLTFIVLRGLNLRQQKHMANAALDFASITVDPDIARDILTTRIPAISYTDTQDRLARYQRSNAEAVERVSLISFNNSGGTYIYDTNGAYLGDKLEYNNYTGPVKAELINGRNDISLKCGDVVLYFRPCRTVDDMLAGYIVVEIRDNFIKQYMPLIALVYVFMLIIGLVIARLIVRYMDTKLFAAIEEITNTLRRFTVEHGESNVMHYAAQLSTDRVDEVGQLSSAMQNVFQKINSSTDSLSKALFDANHDGMTQVYNKRSYHSMEDFFKNCKSICIIYFDVNNLKLMNDTLGHESGDHVIKHAAEYIRRLHGENDYCFRMGGDEFLLVMTECTYRRIDRMVEKIMQDEPYLLNRSTDSIKCALSYGFAYAKGSFDYDALLAEAEENMYIKKAELKALLQMPDR